MRKTSRYLTMPDGVRLAIDLYLPEGQSGPVATILHQTRYFRSVGMRRIFSWLPLAQAMDTDFDTRRRFLAAGYAWVSACVRGSGASGGVSPFPWSEAEILDGACVLDWIVAQPWSNGRVGSTGISYSGTSAEMLASLGHPALRAIAPRFSCYDVYADVAFPGGLHLESFTRQWAELNRLLDSGNIGGAVALNLGLSARGCGDLAGFGWLKAAAHPAAQAVIRSAVGAMAHGVASVDDDEERHGVRAAIQDHAENDDIHEGALRIVHRDDQGMSLREPGASVDSFSPHRRAEAVRASGVAVLGYSGWLDGGYAGAAAKRHHDFGGRHQLVLGPWNHGGQQDVSPFTPMGPASSDDHPGTLLAFFDEHVRERGPAGPSARVRYFTLGEERWKDATEWPPRGAVERQLFLGPDSSLSEVAPLAAGVTTYRVDPAVGTGHRSRWDSLLGLKAPTGYPDADRLSRRAACFTGDRLAQAVEVTGHPRVELTLTSTHADGSVFAYLLDVAPNGSATVVTEGMLRILHRRIAPGPKGLVTPRTFGRGDAEALPPGTPACLVFDLLPVSYRFGAGHSVRLAVTGGDADHFRAVTDGVPTLDLLWGGAWQSHMALPVVALD